MYNMYMSYDIYEYDKHKKNLKLKNFINSRNY